MGNLGVSAGWRCGPTPVRGSVARISARCENRLMPAESHLYGERVWFSDARGVVRRMGVSVHPTDSTVVISLWQGDACTGTFRMPAHEAARLISTLAYGMSEAVPKDGPPSPEGRRYRVRERLAWLVDRALRRTQGANEGHLRLLK
jgi:hypothetical protein